MSVFGVVGLGSIAKRHVKNLRTIHPLSKIYTVSSSGVNNETLAGSNATVSLNELIKLKPTFILIASPATFHIKTAIEIVEANIPVLIEKPLADNYLSALDFVNICKSKDFRNIAVGYCLRFLPAAACVKNIIESEGLGKIYNVRSEVGEFLPYWRPTKNYRNGVSANKNLGGGALLELSHELDYLLWLFGPLNLEHSALRKSGELDVNVEDTADLVLTSETGVHVTIHLDFIQKAPRRFCHIIAEKGRLEWDLIGNTVNEYNSNETVTLYSDANYDKNEMYLDMIKEFKAIETKYSQRLSSIHNSLEVLKIIDNAKTINIFN